MRNRKSIFIVCLIAAIVLCLTGCNSEKAAEEATRQQLQDTVVSGASELGISDMEVLLVERAADSEGKQTTWYATQAESEQFGALSHEEKVDFFRHLHSKADVSIQHHIGCQADMFGENAYGGVQITAGGHTYMYRYHNNAWLLYEDGAVVWDSEQNKTPAANSDGDKSITMDVPCFQCGGDGVTHDTSKDDDNLTCRQCDGKGTLEKTFADSYAYSEYMQNVA